MLTNNSLLKRDSFLLCCRNMLIRELAAVWVAVLLCHLQLTGSQVSGRLLFRYGFSMTSRPALFRVLLSTRNFFSFSPSKSGRKFTVPIFETRSYSSFYSSSIVSIRISHFRVEYFDRIRIYGTLWWWQFFRDKYRELFWLEKWSEQS